jgi:soluble lytic murein transglycosylase-like protein
MQRNKLHYFALYLVSFTLSTGVFHAVAYAQEAVVKQKVQLVTPQTNVPTPTIFVQQKAVLAATTVTTITPTPEPSDEPKQAESKKTVEVIITPEPTAALPTATPTPTAEPTPLPSTPAPSDLESMFERYGNEYGVDKELLKKIAKCESGFNPNANNSGMYLGMFQFASQTWVANRNRMGLDSNPDLRTNAEEAIKTAAYVISKSGPGAWPNCH